MKKEKGGKGNNKEEWERKDRKGKKEKEGHGKNNRVEIVSYFLLFFHDFSPPFHHFPPFFSFPTLFYYLLFFPTISHYLLFLSSPSLSLLLSLHLIISPHPFSHHPLFTSLPSHITPFFLPALFHNPFLPLHPLYHTLLSPHPCLSLPSPFPPSHITPSSLSTLFHFLLLPSHPLSIRKLFSCCMALSGMVKVLENLQVCY